MIHFHTGAPEEGAVTIYLTDQTDDLQNTGLNEAESAFVQKAAAREQSLIPINRYDSMLYCYVIKKKSNQSATVEGIRKGGAELSGLIKAQKAASVHIVNHSGLEDAALHFAQGLALASYQFLKYRKDKEKKAHTLASISFDKDTIAEDRVKALQILTEAAFRSRDLVNEPLNALNATGLASAIRSFGKDAGFSVQVLTKDDMEREGMGGILAVNRGSIDPPTFSIMEHKPAEAKNSSPIVLVGKGVVYDTGGLSLKPTPNSMDRMKSDMSGAALVSAAMWAIAKLELPLHVIALVPSTDNRPGENAYVPGDIITMYGGTTVEVLNTDAEGRMLLGDALHWARRYNPALVMDFATLTGAASAAVGEHGIVCMGTADESVKSHLMESGERQYERLVEYPLWDEYGEQIKSEIADLKNIGGPTGGAITAGKFLQHFTDYPWMHFDIAGVSFSTSRKAYLPIGGTAMGLRMLMDYLMNYEIKA